MTKDTTTTEGLFDPEEFIAEGDTTHPALQAIHAAGRKLLEPLVVAPAKALFRTRDASALLGYPDRGFQVTVRVSTAGGSHAEEFQRMQDREIGEYAYGWLAGRTLHRAVVLNAPKLAQDILDRPGCLVPASRTRLAHHAPGGAEFYVVDIRRVTPDVVIRTVGFELESRAPAPRQSQDELW